MKIRCVLFFAGLFLIGSPTVNLQAGSAPTSVNADGKEILPPQHSSEFWVAPAGANCENSWSLVASLNWGVVADWDLHLQTPSAHVYYGNRSADGFTLDRDAHPVCTPTPLPPEGITGMGHCGTYRVYSDLFSTCGGSPPSTFTATVTVARQITINGVGYSPGQTFHPQDGVDFSVAANGAAAIEVTVDNPPADSIYRIGPEPRMPQIQARARVTGVTPDPTAMTTFTWTLSVHYDASQSPHGPPRVFDYDWSGSTTGNAVLNTDFGGVIRGGNVTLTARATVNGMQVMGQKTGYKILGYPWGTPQDTETRHNMRTLLKNSTLRKVASFESSGGHQFAQDCYPFWSGDNKGGVGVMQLTAPTPAPDEVWDWSKNVGTGLRIFKEKMGAARRLQKNVESKTNLLVNQDRLRQGRLAIRIKVPPLTTHGSNLATFDQEFEGVVYSDTLDQLEQDAIRLYNGAGGHDIFAPGLHEFQLLRAQPRLPAFVEPNALIETTRMATAIWRHVTAQDRLNQYPLPAHYPGDANYVADVLGAADLPP